MHEHDVVNRAGGPNDRIKRVFDVVVALMMLVLFLPIITIVAASILVRDGGPVLFRHKRVERHGRMFNCLKFRTMIRDSDRVLEDLLVADAGARAEWNARQKLRDDPRIIPGIGHFLRRTSLDELPQIFNVLRGEMSIVGPRPVVAEELKHYGHAVGLYLSVKPGLTGPWQIGGRSDTTYAERVRLDLDYIQNWSLLKDIVIVLKTARCLTGSKDSC